MAARGVSQFVVVFQRSRGCTNDADVSAQLGISRQSSGANVGNRWPQHVPECVLWTDCMQ